MAVQVRAGFATSDCGVQSSTNILILGGRLQTRMYSYATCKYSQGISFFFSSSIRIDTYLDIRTYEPVLIDSQLAVMSAVVVLVAAVDYVSNVLIPVLHATGCLCMHSVKLCCGRPYVTGPHLKLQICCWAILLLLLLLLLCSTFFFLAIECIFCQLEHCVWMCWRAAGEGLQRQHPLHAHSPVRLQ